MELNTKRLRNRPSLFVYGGGNEGEAPYTDKVLTNMGKLTYDNDGTRDFWRQDGGMAAANIRHDHIWWSGHTPEYYIKTYTSVKELNMHEYGLGSMMNRSSIEKYATDAEIQQWPVQKKGTISYHTATFNGYYGWNPTPHGYDIDTHMYYAGLFTEVNGLDDLIRGSQLSQAQADYPLAINSRIKAPYNSANVIYKLNDNYPGASWSIVDWYGAPKLSYYLMQDAYRPLMAAALADHYNTFNAVKEPEELKLPVYILDDTQQLSGKKAQVKVTAYGEELQIIKTETFDCKTGDAVNYAKEFYLSAEQTAHTPLILVYDLIIEGGFYNRTYMYYNYESEPGCLFYLPRTTLEYTVSGNDVTIKNTGDKIAVGVELVSGEEDTFVCSDNIFILDPGQSQTVTVNDVSKLSSVTCFNIVYSEDKTAPSAPADVSVSDVTCDGAKISWTASEDDTGIYTYTVTLADGKDERNYTVHGAYNTAEITGLDEVCTYTVTVKATDNGGNVSAPSTAVEFTTEQDTTTPYVTGFYAENGVITVDFSTEMNKNTAEDPARYLLDRGASVKSAALSENGRTVTLTTEGFGEKTGYTLGIINVTDTKRAGNGTGYVELDIDQGLYMSVDFEEGENGISYSKGQFSAPIEDVVGEPFYTDEGQSGRALLTSAGRGAQVRNVSYTFGEGKSITMWINGKASDGFNLLLAKGPKETGHFEFYTRSGLLYMYAPDCGDFNLGYNINKGSGWRQLAFIFSGGKITVYENGKEVSSKDIPGKIRETVHDMSIGTLNDGTFAYGGSIDTVRLYDRVLSVDELYSGDGGEEMQNDKLDFENHVIELELSDGASAPLGLINGNIPYTLSLSGDSVSVKDGVIYAEKEGVTVISVISEDKTKISGAVVTVREKPTETEPVTETETETQTEAESDTQTEEKTAGGKWIIIAAAAAAAVAVCAVVAVIVIKKRKK